MQAPKPIDVSMHHSSFTGKLILQHERPQIGTDQQAEHDRIIQRKIVYYSDFELDMNEWRIENECIQIYSQTLRKSLGEAWIGKLDKVLFKLIDTDQMSTPDKNAWGVALEYVLLTEHSKKDAKQQIDELEAYYSFYGHHIGDPAMFSVLMTQLLALTPVATDAITKFVAFENNYQLMQKGKLAANLKTLYKETAHNIVHKKTHPIKYVLRNRIVSPLMLANVRVVEQYFHTSEPMDMGSDTSKVEANLEQMSIQENECAAVAAVAATMIQPDAKGQSKSLKIKRSFMEMQKLESANYDLFSIGVLNAIFAYMDYQSGKVPENNSQQYSVIGHFAVVLYEIHAPELKNIHTLIAVDTVYDNINLRVIKPHKQFYRLLLRVALKFGLLYFSTVNKADYLNAVQHHIGAEWSSMLRAPVEFFFDCCKGLVKELQSKGTSEFFEMLRGKLMEMWEMDVIQKSGTFKKGKAERK